MILKLKKYSQVLIFKECEIDCNASLDESSLEYVRWVSTPMTLIYEALSFPLSYE